MEKFRSGTGPIVTLTAFVNRHVWNLELLFRCGGGGGSWHRVGCCVVVVVVVVNGHLSHSLDTALNEGIDTGAPGFHVMQMHKLLRR